MAFFRKKLLARESRRRPGMDGESDSPTAASRSCSLLFPKFLLCPHLICYGHAVCSPTPERANQAPSGQRNGQSPRPSSVPTHVGSGEKRGEGRSFQTSGGPPCHYWTGIGQSWGQAPGILLHPFRVLTPGILVDLSTSLVGVRNLALVFVWLGALCFSILSFPSPGPKPHAIRFSRSPTSSSRRCLPLLLPQFPKLVSYLLFVRSLSGFGSARYNLRVLSPSYGPDRRKIVRHTRFIPQPNCNCIGTAIFADSSPKLSLYEPYDPYRCQGACRSHSRECAASRWDS
jgi:hypothetical protein